MKLDFFCNFAKNQIIKNKMKRFGNILLFIGASSVAFGQNSTIQDFNPFGNNNDGLKLIADSGVKKAPVSGNHYIIGPKGEAWSYTASYEMERIYVSEYYTEEIPKSFTFKFFDSSHRLVGTVHDIIRYAPNERRDRECYVYPQITTDFFNTDDLPEIMVFHAMNTDEYINHYYYGVYSIGGEKDEDGYDVETQRIEGRCIEVLNHSYAANDGRYLFTFVEDPYVNMPLNDPDYVAKLNAMSYRVTTYANATEDSDGPVKFMVKDIGATRIPGDTTEGIYYMSKRYEGRLYFIYSQYEKPFFIDPRGSAEDETATPDNALLIDVYDVTGSQPETVSTTVIPVNEVQDDEKLVYTFLGIGSVGGAQDVDMKYNGTPSSPAFLVTRSVAYAADIDNMKSSYYIYDAAGNLTKTIAEDTESMVLYNNGDAEGPLAMFVQSDNFGNYVFVFAFIYSGNVLATISQANNGDPLYASSYPVKIDGEYKFVFEMKYFVIGSLGNLYARVAWFDKNGKLERIDPINLGTDVQAAKVYLANVTLDPKLFDNDDAMEYAVLVKRTHGNTVRNEYLIVDDNGGRYAAYSADDGRGEPLDLTINQGWPRRMTITYENGARSVALPFTTASTDAPEGETVPVTKVDSDDKDDNENSGDEEDDSSVKDIIIEGPEDVVFYNLQGHQITNPGRGIYIKVTDGKPHKVVIR